MKTLFFILVVGVIAGAVGWQHYQHNQKPSIGEHAAALAERTQEAAMTARDAVAAKVGEWKLNPENIKEELAKTGRVVRSQALAASDRIDDARIVTVIKGKYIAEQNLSSFEISVECHDGAVKLSGSVISAEQVGQAMGLALQTHGVRSVVSNLAVKTTS